MDIASARSSIAMNNARSISLKTTWKYILADLARYRVTDQRSYLAIMIMCPGAMAGIWYRLGYWIWHYDGTLRRVERLLRPIYVVLQRIIMIVTGIWISPRAHIGPGLYINHFGNVIVGEVEIGSNCNLSHEVTLGNSGRGNKRGLPILGDRVFIAPGAKVLGKICVGNDAVVGANAVVTKSVPDRAVMIGAPAQVTSYKGSFDFVYYAGMESDPDRLESLALSESEE